jgi:hypothetical protein
LTPGEALIHALRLGVNEVVVSRNADKMQKQAGSLDFNAKARIVEGT